MKSKMSKRCKLAGTNALSETVVELQEANRHQDFRKFLFSPLFVRFIWAMQATHFFTQFSSCDESLD